MNLYPPVANPLNERPHQPGHASGRKRGALVRIAIEWMVDTGADITTVRNATGASFDLTASGGTASPTTGGGGILIYTGLTAEFQAEDRSSRTNYPVTSTQPVGVKSGNTGSEILGMDALSSNAVDVEWKPGARNGTLWFTAPASVRTATSLRPSARPDAGADETARRRVTPPGITDHGTWLDIGGVRVEKRLWGK